jgi:hypothetical protein
MADTITARKIAWFTKEVFSENICAELTKEQILERLADMYVAPNLREFYFDAMLDCTIHESNGAYKVYTHYQEEFLRYAN